MEAKRGIKNKTKQIIKLSVKIMDMGNKIDLQRERVISIINQAGIGMPVTLSHYELILECELSKAIVDSAVFFVNRHAGSSWITEVRLSQQDIFFCFEWGLFLLDTVGDMDIGFEEHTFPDEMYFSGGSAKELDILYNADLRLVVNNMTLLPGIRTDVFKKYQTVIDRRGAGESGLREIGDGGVMLLGMKNCKFILGLPRKAEWKDSKIRMRLRLRGFLAKNASIMDSIF